jgi:hypothetical protein
MCSASRDTAGRADYKPCEVLALGTRLASCMAGLESSFALQNALAVLLMRSVLTFIVTFVYDVASGGNVHKRSLSFSQLLVVVV